MTHIKKSYSSEVLSARTQSFEDNSQGFTFKTKHIAPVKTSWVQRHPDAVRNLKIAGVTALVLGLLVGGGLLAMHFTVGINSAGFDKLWTALTTKHQFTTAQVILYGVVPVVGMGTAGVLAYKLVACYRAHHKDDQRFQELRVEDSTDPIWVEGGAEIGREEGKPANRGRSNSLPPRLMEDLENIEKVLKEIDEVISNVGASQQQPEPEPANRGSLPTPTRPEQEIGGTTPVSGKEKSDVKMKSTEELFAELTEGNDSGLFG